MQTQSSPGRETVPILTEKRVHSGGDPYRSAFVPQWAVKDGFVFGWDPMEKALEDCVNEGCQALFMPELAIQRLLQDKESKIWRYGFDSLSLKATGYTKAGNQVVVFAHVPHYFCDPENIKKVKQEVKIRNGAGELPEQEFYRLLDLEDDQKVFVVDPQELKSAQYGWIEVDRILNEGHPFVRPFLGLSEEDTVKYLKEARGNTRSHARYPQIHLRSKMDGAFRPGRRSIYISFADDTDSVPRGRLLFLGINLSDGLYGNIMYYYGRFVGVCERSEL